jgi:hypothetical protein
MTGRRGGARSGWLRRRDPVSRAVLVVAVALVGVGPRADPPGGRGVSIGAFGCFAICS